MKKLLLFLFFILSFGKIYSQVFTVDTIYYNGNPDNRINLLIMGDGYQNSELPQFRIDAKSVADYFFNVPPFSIYKNFFNIFAIEVVSNESGNDHPGTATDEIPGSQPITSVDNYLQTTFDYGGTHRCVISNQQAIVYSIANTNFPSWDFVNVIINTPYYGGCSNGVAYTTMNSASPEVFAHEFGHMFGLLSDEYPYGGTNCTSGVGQRINVSQRTDTSILGWKNWLTATTYPTPNGTQCGSIGLYEGANTCDSNWYRPKCDCKMRDLNIPYCEVCYEQFIYRISIKVNYIENYFPLNPAVSVCNGEQKQFTVNVINNTDSTIRTQWLLDNVLVSTNTDNFVFNSSLYTPGNHQLVVSTYDTTLKARKQLGSYHRIWNISVLSASISSPDSVTFCSGDSSHLSASRGLHYTYQWLKNDSVIPFTDSVLVVQSPGDYSVIISNGICTDTSSKINVKINSSPDAAVVLHGENTLCTGSSVLLTATLCNSCSGQWKKNGVDIPGAESDSLIVDSAGTYSISISDTVSGCSLKSAPENILFLNAVVSSGKTIFCENDSAILVVNPPGVQYQWYRNSILLTGKVNDSLVVKTEGNYFSIVSNSLCSDTSNTTAVLIDPLPVVSFSGLQDTMCIFHPADTLSGNPPGGIFSGLGMNGNVFSPASAGTGNHLISYQYSDSIGCSGEFSKNVFVDVCDGIENMTSNKFILIYPNPSTGKIFIENNSSENKKLSIKIFDLPGKTVKTIYAEEIISKNSKREIDCSELTAGIYFMQVSSSGREYLNRFVIIK